MYWRWSKCSDTIAVIIDANGCTSTLTSLLQSVGRSHQDNGSQRSVARTGSKASVSTDDRQLPNAPDISTVDNTYAQVQDENAKALKYLTEAYQNGGSTSQVLCDSCRYNVRMPLLPSVTIRGRRNPDGCTHAKPMCAHPDTLRGVALIIKTAILG